MVLTLDAVTTVLLTLPAVAPVPGVPKVAVGPYSMIQEHVAVDQLALAVVAVMLVAAVAVVAGQAAKVVNVPAATYPLPVPA